MLLPGVIAGYGQFFLAHGDSLSIRSSGYGPGLQQKNLIIGNGPFDILRCRKKRLDGCAEFKQSGDLWQ